MKADAFVDLPTFRVRLEQELRKGRTDFALARIEYDRVDRIREWFGDEISYYVSSVLAQRLMTVVGDRYCATFVMDAIALAMLPVTGEDPDSVAEAAWDLMEFIGSPIDVARLGELSIGCSVGVAHPNTLLDRHAPSLINAATTAAHHAAALGSRRVSVFESAQGLFGRQGQLDQSQQRALNAHQIIPWFQPQVRLEDGIIVAAEALARWNHPTFGLVLPAEFVPEAEHSGFIRSIDRAITDRAFAEAATWPSHVRVSVNLSAANLDDPRLASHFEGVLERVGLDPTRAIVEVTETALAQNKRAALRRIADLRALGVRVALDDFGAGHAFLDALAEGIFDELKVDRALIRSWDTAASRAVLTSIVDLAGSMGLLVVAEGIETVAELDHALEAGCHIGQGFLLFEPMTSMDFTELATGRPFEVPVDFEHLRATR
jgi:EAL domain-containing protein (putative c-di-GMP-specific phosphodiesterase class I)/GGDEF domain-containing protein